MLAVLVPVVAIVSASLILSVIKLMPLRNSSSITQPIVLDNISTKVLEINDIKYNFSYYPDRAGILNSAVSFCSDNGDKFGLTVDTIKNCVQSITRAIHQSHAKKDMYDYASEESKRIITVSDFPNPRRVTVLKIMGNDKPPMTPDNNHVDFDTVDCNTDENYTSISELLPHDSADVPIESVKDENAIDHQKSVNVEVNGLTYVFDFPPLKLLSRDKAANQLATQFCTIHRAALKLETVEEIVVENRCMVPLRDTLIAEINKIDIHS